MLDLKTMKESGGNVVRKGALALVLSAGLLTSAWAEKSLVNDLSSLDFMSIKKGTVIEPHTFDKLSGTLMDDGTIEIAIDLASVNTKIEIRDERMRTVLFNAAKHGSASLVAKVDMDSLEEGKVQKMEVEGTLDLHGVSKAIKTNLIVAHMGKSIMVSNADPIILNADDFGLGEGLDMLQKIAQLPSITHSVPVSFTFVFQ